MYNKGRNAYKSKTYKHCKKCTSSLGSSKFIYPTKKDGLEDIASRQNHKIYKCPYGYGWHSTTDLNYERRKFLIQDFDNLKINLFKEDLVVELKLNEKNYLMKSFLEKKTINNINFYTFWSFAEDITDEINLKRHQLLYSYLIEKKLKLYEFEFIKNSAQSGFGYAAINSKTKYLKNFFKQQGLDYYFYITSGGILRLKTSIDKK